MLIPVASFLSLFLFEGRKRTTRVCCTRLRDAAGRCVLPIFKSFVLVCQLRPVAEIHLSSPLKPGRAGRRLFVWTNTCINPQQLASNNTKGCFSVRFKMRRCQSLTFFPEFSRQRLNSTFLIYEIESKTRWTVRFDRSVKWLCAAGCDNSSTRATGPTINNTVCWKSCSRMFAAHGGAVSIEDWASIILKMFNICFQVGVSPGRCPRQEGNTFS